MRRRPILCPPPCHSDVNSRHLTDAWLDPLPTRVLSFRSPVSSALLLLPTGSSMKRLVLLLIPAVLTAFLASPRGASGADDNNLLTRRYFFPFDSLVLARVDDRIVTCFDFRRRWFDVDPRLRTGTDS